MKHQHAAGMKHTNGNESSQESHDAQQYDLQKFICPMHPQIVRDEPGKCPLCGMDLVPLGSPASGHHHHNTMIEDFKKRFYVVLILAIPILLLSEMIQHWLSIHISFTGSQYLLLLLSTVVFFYGGWLFLKGLVSEV
jgi:Cu2+-exporting ATPase